ncbi:MAG: hypothetical protein AB8B99_13740 [Phormidesmis sp.]
MAWIRFSEAFLQPYQSLHPANVQTHTIAAILNYGVSVIPSELT